MNAPERTTSATAVISLVFGVICWVAIPFIGAIVAVICGHVARGEIRRAPPGSIEGEGMAIAGMALGYVHLALIALLVCLFFTVFGGFAALAAADWHY
jgi:hypothetical protein